MTPLLTPKTLEIHAIADALVAQGTPPTSALIRQGLGNVGSYSTITAAMKTWPGRETNAILSIPEAAPESVEHAAIAMAAAIWKTAQEIASGRLQAERDALEDARVHLEQERDSAIAISDTQELELEQTRARITSLTAELTLAHQSEQQSRAATVLAGTRAETAEATLSECRLRAEVLAADVVRERADADVLRIALETAQNARQGAQQGLAVAQAQLDAERASRASCEVREAALIRQLASVQEHAAATAKELADMRVEMATKLQKPPRKPRQPKTGA